jgi:hypothetical protein
MLLGLQTSSLINELTVVSMSVHEESHFISAQGLHPFKVSVNFYIPYLQSIYTAESRHFKINSSHSYRFVCGKQENLSICLRSEKKFIFFMESILNVCATSQGGVQFSTVLDGSINKFSDFLHV